MLNISFVYSKSVSILFYHYDQFIHFDDLFADLFCWTLSCSYPDGWFLLLRPADLLSDQSQCFLKSSESLASLGHHHYFLDLFSNLGLHLPIPVYQPHWGELFFQYKPDHPSAFLSTSVVLIMYPAGLINMPCDLSLHLRFQLCVLHQHWLQLPKLLDGPWTHWHMLSLSLAFILNFYLC